MHYPFWRRFPRLVRSTAQHNYLKSTPAALEQGWRELGFKFNKGARPGKEKWFHLNRNQPSFMCLPKVLKRQWLPFYTKFTVEAQRRNPNWIKPFALIFVNQILPNWFLWTAFPKLTHNNFTDWRDLKCMSVTKISNQAELKLVQPSLSRDKLSYMYCMC